MLKRLTGAVVSLAACGGGLWGICQVYTHRFTLPHTVSTAIGSSFVGGLLVRLLVIALAVAILSGFIGFLVSLFCSSKK